MPVTCPLCQALMAYRPWNDTHIWSCSECPGVLFEYYTPEDHTQLGAFLHRPWHVAAQDAEGGSDAR